jgi:hypothetical protein
MNETQEQRKEKIINRVVIELKKSEMLNPTFPSDPIHAAALVNEKAARLLDAAVKNTYVDQEPQDLLVAAIQAGAALLRFVENIHLYQIRPSK